MKTIKFTTERYCKLEGVVGSLQLLHVFVEDYKNLGQEFREYDTLYLTQNGEDRYKLPKTGECLVLFFLDIETGRVFTTVRSSWPSYKKEYYIKSIGEFFEIKISE